MYSFLYVIVARSQEPGLGTNISAENYHLLRLARELGYQPMKNLFLKYEPTPILELYPKTTEIGIHLRHNQNHLKMISFGGIS